VSGIPAGTYEVCYISLPPGYQIINPTTGPPPFFTVSVGPSVINKDFAIALLYGPWIQSTGTDIRFDSGGFNDPIPSTATLACGGPNASIPGTGTSPGIIFSGDSSPNFGQGQASSKNWVVGGASYPEVFAPTKGGGFATSYAYVSSIIKQAGLERKDLTPYCKFPIGGGTGLSNCVLPTSSTNFPHGLYKANEDLTLKGGSPTFNFSNGTQTSVLGKNSITWSHTIGLGSDRLLVVRIYNNAISPSLATVTYGGTNLLNLGTKDDGIHRVEIWYMLNPPVGIASIVATLPVGFESWIAGNSTSFSNANQAIPFNGMTLTTNTGRLSNGGTMSVTGIPTSPSEMVVDIFARDLYAPVAIPAVLGQTQDFLFGSSGAYASFGSHKTSTSTMAWATSGGSDSWVAAAVSIRRSGLTTYTFPAGNYVILVNGNLTIDTKLIVPPGSTVTFIVSGDITVTSSVGESVITSTASDIEGFYSTDKSFIIQGTNNCSVGTDKRLNVAGTIVVNAAKTGGSFQYLRDLCGGNASCPVFSIQERVDFILNAPELIKRQNIIYREEAP